VTRYTAEAIDQIDALRIDYVTKNRGEAALALEAVFASFFKKKRFLS
jgi:hypothetical protein